MVAIVLIDGGGVKLFDSNIAGSFTTNVLADANSSTAITTLQMICLHPILQWRASHKPY
jgi:hypothetical protein